MKSRPLVGAGGWLQEYWPYVCNVLGGCGLGLAGGAPTTHGQIMVPVTGWGLDKGNLAWTAAILLAVGLVGLYRRERQISTLRLRAENAESRVGISERVVRALSRVELNILSDSLHHYSTERVSLFVPAPGGFVLVARWTKNPSLTGSSRQLYPHGQGVVWKAWQDGKALALNLPDPLTAPQDWLEVQVNDWNLPEETVAAMTMRSRTYIAFRIEDRGTGREPNGVIIFESQLTAEQATTQKLAPEDLEAAVRREEPRLRVLLEEMAKLVATAQSTAT